MRTSAIPTMLRGWGAIPDLMNGIFTTAATPRSATKASGVGERRSIYPGDVPWSMLPLLGSDERMRGYYQGAIAIKCAEHPAGVSSPAYRRHGIVAWVGAGTMGPSVDSLNDGRWLPTAGVGYRFEFKPRVNIRLDYGIGKGSGGFYFQVGEAF